MTLDEPTTETPSRGRSGRTSSGARSTSRPPMITRSKQREINQQKLVADTLAAANLQVEEATGKMEDLQHKLQITQERLESAARKTHELEKKVVLESAEASRKTVQIDWDFRYFITWPPII
ncbi:hypothetical protein JR316_0012355 [Psilocybe cubensis]|uniref:Uncharacterized protein n=1 Tax=Psilocybe cubensis TaxID=181762 RepID=A0ACB8GIC7_PSICU|nr:hypothetical protein JR316_0012355 [Psilocybe cubensis]KAH9475244.1 hypothetical protein JR316_0012355 [Psilocybe cubensis]